MRKLPIETQSFLCTCSEECEHYLIIEGLGRYCEKQAKEIALNIITVVNEVHRISSNKKDQGWLYEESKMIIDWYARKNGKAEYGDVPMLAEMLGRSIISTKSHIRHLREQGKL